MFKMKEQNKTTEEELSKVKISNLPNKEFKIMMIEMFDELRRRIDEHNENFNKKVENVKKNQTELKNIITKIKKTLKESVVDQMTQRNGFTN